MAVAIALHLQGRLPRCLPHGESSRASEQPQLHRSTFTRLFSFHTVRMLPSNSRRERIDAPQLLSVIGGAGLPTGVFCLMAVGDYDFDMASTIFVGALTVAAVVASLSTMALMW